jgi:predicted nucleotidyltransferase
MQRDEILRVLRDHQAELTGFGVRSLAVFGSVARDEAAADSDVDILVEFDEPVGLFEFVRLQMRLETLLGRRVDLVTRDALRTTMRDQILNEAVYAT